MKGIGPFELLLLAHLIGDFLFQNQWMAFNKQKLWLPLIVHCTIYTGIVGVISYLLLEQPLSYTGIAVIFIGHIVLDQGSFIRWWYKNICGCTDPKTWWLKIVYDQIFHIILLGVALQV
jgi:hypothetical protein